MSLDFEEKFKEARTNPERRRVLDRFLEEEYGIAKDAPWWIEANRLIPRMERDPTERTTQVDVKPEREPQRGFEGLPQKGTDLSKYIDGARLTDRQRDCFSLKYEYGLPEPQIALRLRLKHHSTVQEHIARAKTKVDRARNRMKNSLPE